MFCHAKVFRRGASEELISCELISCEGSACGVVMVMYVLYEEEYEFLPSVRNVHGGRNSEIIVGKNNVY